jgi:Asp-tRNA(Asn)/Glu-tRNA(Gln) amidotransferase A subunit family amidase
VGAKTVELLGHVELVGQHDDFLRQSLRIDGHVGSEVLHRTTETLALLESIGPTYNAVATVTRERALREAAAADRAVARRAARSPLLGIPYGAKDLLAAKGAPTTWGAPPYADQIIYADATAIAKLKEVRASSADAMQASCII